MPKCTICKEQTKGKYWVIKYNNKIVAHICKPLCLKLYGHIEEKKSKDPQTQSPLEAYFK